MPAKGQLGDQGNVDRAPAVAGCEQVQAAFDADQAKGYVGQRPPGAWPRGPHDLLDSGTGPAGLLALHRHRAWWHFPDLAG